MVERLTEPSTWAGLAVLFAQAGKLIAPQWAFIFDGIAFIAGGAAVGIPERKAN